MSGAKAYVRGVVPDPENRQRDDFYPTPPVGTEALLDVESFEGLIWEPACGDGAICKVLEAAGYKTIASDLIDRGYGEHPIDFLMEWRSRAPNIITNPPFKFSQKFAEKALSLTTGKVAFLCRLAWLEGSSRKDMFTSTPLKNVWVFSKRLGMSRNGEDANPRGGMIAFAWFVWEHGYEGRPHVGWL